MNKYIDLNGVQFYKSGKDEIGCINNIELNSENKIVIQVSIDPGFYDNYMGYFRDLDGTSLLLCDKYFRYLTHNDVVFNNKNRNTIITEYDLIFPLDSLLNISPVKPIKVALLFNSFKTGLLINVPDDKYNYLEKALRKNQSSSIPDVPSFKSKLRDLIIDSTSHKYVSRSNQDLILTGNNYQTLDLGDTLRLGGRINRFNKLKQVKFKDKSVLDIGANTGEISRYIRKLGARLVDGYEYDCFFVETGRMINAFLGTSRVSLNQGDVTNPGLYTEKYDLVVALSVYVYIKKVLANISSITDSMLFETHTLDHGLDFYLKYIKTFFPCVKHLGYTDEDPKFKKSRALLLFTKTAAQIKELVNLDKLLIPDGNINYYYADEKRKFSPNSLLHSTNLDILQNKGLDVFLNNIERDYGSVDVDALNDDAFNFFSNYYWAFFLLGYKDYTIQKEQVDEKNRFYTFYSQAISKSLIDPNLKNLLNDIDTILYKIKLKYIDLEYARVNSFDNIPPLQLMNDKKNENKFCFKTASGETVYSTNIDGHHRLFMAKLFNEKSLSFFQPSANINSFQSNLIKSQYTLTD